MKKYKLLQKTITRLAEASFKDGKMMENQILKSIKILKSLPASRGEQALAGYLKELKRKEREHIMYIETVIPLHINQIKKIKKIVEKRHKITKMVAKINPEILGGFKLRIGDEIWDESILGKINQVKEAIRG